MTSTRNWMNPAILLGSIAPLLVACPSTTSVMSKRNDLSKALGEAGWTLLPVPDSNYGPGIVIYYPEGAASPRYVGQYASCGVPSDLMKTKIGESPTIDSSQTFDLNVKLAVSYLNVKVGPEFSNKRTAKITLKDHGSEVLDLIAIEAWRTDPKNSASFAQVCKEYFSSDGYYLVNEGWRIKNGEISFHSTPSAGVSATGVTVSPELSVGGSTNISAINDGKLVFSNPAYVAIRGATSMKGGFRFLGGSDTVSTADGRLTTWAAAQ